MVQTAPSQPVQIRSAQNNDWEQIRRLQSGHQIDLNRLADEQYRQKVQASGFLIGDYSQTEFKQDQQEIFLVAEVENQIVGYLRIEHQANFRDNQYKKWSNAVEREQYYVQPHAEIGAMVVDDRNRGQGIGSLLLRESISQLDQRYSTLYSIITTGPVENQASLNFHEKMGFVQVALSLPHRLFGIDNYQSVLMKCYLSPQN